jgi:hypothetical protein
VGAVVELLWNLCLLRVGPERMPTASLFLVAVLAANLSLTVLVFLSAGIVDDPLLALTLWCLQAAVLGGGTWGVLQLRGLGERFSRTFGAILGADLVITAVQWPVALLAAGASGGLPLILAIVELALLFWWLTILGFVFSRALDASRAQGVAVAVFLFLASILLTGSLYPPPGPEASPEPTAPIRDARAAAPLAPGPETA